MSPSAVSQRLFFAAAAVLFVAGAGATLAACHAMAAMPDMPMPGGWTLSMMWMRMPGQTWPGLAAAWLGMWQAMTVAMMLPVLLPALKRYRATHTDALTACVALAYFAVWALLGAALFVLGALFAAGVLESDALARAVPYLVGCVVLGAGALQFSAWKRRRLARCRDACGGGAMLPGARHAWHFGRRLGFDCVQCCAGPTAVLLALGMMDLRAMALVTLAIALERLAPQGERVARAFGVLGAIAGCVLLLQLFIPLHAAIR